MASSNSSKQDPPFLDWGSLAGLVDGEFLKAPKWVDESLPPGTTSEEAVCRSGPNWKSLLTGHYIFFSPNLVWLVIALVVYFGVPYPYDLARDFNNPEFQDWVRRRALFNVGLVMAYDGFFHVILYGLKWAKRPFAQGRTYRWSKTIHNVFYCILGALQWTGWEAIMIHLYATGRIGYISDEKSFGSAKGLLWFYATCVIVPIFRELHFFFVHRFSHNRFAYKYIHALHHRVTDTDPFSGICMSPMEHLYYFSSIAPSVYWHASPFAFLWNGIHLVLSPGASHSGWEDHWHSDQFHFAHHRYFECNYGTPGIPLDMWFGCMRETLAPQTKTYHGDSGESASGSDKKQDDNRPVAIQAREDAKATLLGIPSWDQILYHIATSLALPWCFWMTFRQHDSTNPQLASLVAAMVAFGPLVVALFLSFLTAPQGTFASIEKARNTLLYPFHREALVGRYGVMLVVTTLVSLLPIYHFAHAFLVADANDTAYHRIWG